MPGDVVWSAVIHATTERKRWGRQMIRHFAMALALLSALSLASCGGGRKSEPAQPATAAPAATSDPAVQALQQQVINLQNQVNMLQQQMMQMQGTMPPAAPAPQ